MASMSKLEDPEETVDKLEELVELYDELEASTDDFMAEQDASMKRTSLKSIIRDIERYELD